METFLYIVLLIVFVPAFWWVVITLCSGVGSSRRSRDDHHDPGSMGTHGHGQ